MEEQGIYDCYYYVNLSKQKAVALLRDKAA